MRYLRAARELCQAGEDLVCAIAPNAYIRDAKHRAERWSQVDRAQTVQSLSIVTRATLQDGLSVSEVIYDDRPRLLVKGEDWRGRLPEDVLAACAETGCHVVYVNTPGVHVSETMTSDEDALARFEALVLSQPQTVAPWMPVTDYSFEARRIAEGRHPALLLETFHPRCLLDVGCGPCHLLRLLREQATWPLGLFGLDRSVPDGPHYYQGDITDERPIIQWPLLYLPFDLVVCREVLEHIPIRRIGRAVRNLCTLSARYVYVTTRFAHEPAHLLSVDTSDDLDPTHISMLNQTFLRALFVLEGFKRRADLEAKMDWKQLGRVLVYERA